ncbi:MAG: class I SAM-dependent methyltransferase [Dehalococcoidia bacterium]
MLGSLALQDRVFEPLLEEIANWLNVEAGERVLDAGCGTGGMTAVLAGRGATVDAVDESLEHVDATVQLVERRRVATRVNVAVGDIASLDYADGTFDVVWCSRVLHHVPDMLAAARELARVVRPGGRVAIREGGFPFRVLPDDVGLGEPWIENRLSSAGVGLFVRSRDLHDSSPYPHGWARLLRDAGLDAVAARTFATDSLSPLSKDEREWVTRQWQRWLDRTSDDDSLAPDRDTLRTLMDSDSPHYVFNRDDLHLRTGHSVYVGMRAR